MWSEKFEHSDKKNKNVKNLKLQVKNNNKQSDLVTKNERIMDGVATWASFYRSNPHKFCEDYLDINLRLFQKVLLYSMMHNNHFMYCAARGI